MRLHDEAVKLAVEMRADMAARGMGYAAMIRAVGLDPAAYRDGGMLTGDSVIVALAEAWLSLGGRKPRHRVRKRRAPSPSLVEMPRTRVRVPTAAELEAELEADRKAKVAA